MAHEHKKSFVLPVQVTSPADIVRLIRELESIDDALTQLGLRTPKDSIKMPNTSALLEKILTQNDLNLLVESNRLVLKKYFLHIKQNAPIMHFSFSTDPSPEFSEKLLSWLRREIHPLVLVRFGLQPSIGVGCLVRTTNKHFDFSLKQEFARHRDLILSRIAPVVPESTPA
ncbi:MAG: hypothetical protein NVS1B10_00890 [Candidatus Saccharimonadales bacterium]